MKIYAAFILYFFFCLLSSQALFSQDFSSVDSDLALLENLIADTLLNTEKQQKLLDDLRKSLDEKGNIINGQENLLKDLQARLSEMSETYRMQSALSVKYERRSRFWRTFTLIAIPATAIASGAVVWGLSK